MKQGFPICQVFLRISSPTLHWGEPKILRNGGRGEESRGRNRSFFRSEGKLMCANECFPAICQSSKRHFVCTCISPVLSLALLIVTTKRNTPSRELAERWKAQAGALALNQHPAWPLPPLLRVSWPSGCSAFLSSVTTFSRNTMWRWKVYGNRDIVLC